MTTHLIVYQPVSIKRELFIMNSSLREQSSNKIVYLDILSFKRCSRMKRPEFRRDGKKLLHDNVSAHRTQIITQYLDKCSVTVLQHLSYSPHLMFYNVLFLPKTKNYLKNKDFGMKQRLRLQQWMRYSFKE